MKKILLVGLLVLSVFLISCGEETLPPEPAPPGAIPTEGSGAIAGQAVAYAGYAVPGTNFHLPTSLFRFFERGAGDYLTAIVRGDQFIYKTGYITDQNLAWVPFEYSGERIGDSNWLRGSAMAAGLSISLESNVEGENYIVAYGCTRRLGTWDCHGNQWMLQTFNVSFSGCGDACPPGYACVEDECVALPEEPTAPGTLWFVNVTPTNVTNATNLTTCTDSDGYAALAFSIKGTTYNSTFSGTDYCINSTHFVEFFCMGGAVALYAGRCSVLDGTPACTNGVCQGMPSLNQTNQTTSTNQTSAINQTGSSNQTSVNATNTTASCTDECSSVNLRACSGGSSGGYLRACGWNYDADFCLEWGYYGECPYGCINGVCQPGPSNQTGTTNQTGATNQTNQSG